MKTFRITLALIIIFIVIISNWSNIINLMMPPDSRPCNIKFSIEQVTPQQFDEIIDTLTKIYGQVLPHAQRFKDAGILSYEGPQTCLSCHETINYTNLTTDEEQSADLMDNLHSS